MCLEDAMNLNKSNHPILTAPLVFQGFCFLFQLVWTHPVCRSFFCLLLDRGRTGGSAWIASRLWNHLSPNYWTSQSGQTGFSSASIHLLINRWPELSPLYQAHGYFSVRHWRRFAFETEILGKIFYIYLTNWFFENHLTKLAVICVKTRQKTGFLSPIRVRQAPKSH